MFGSTSKEVTLFCLEVTYIHVLKRDVKQKNEQFRYVDPVLNSVPAAQEAEVLKVLNPPS